MTTGSLGAFLTAHKREQGARPRSQRRGARARACKESRGEGARARACKGAEERAARPRSQGSKGAPAKEQKELPVGFQGSSDGSWNSADLPRARENWPMGPGAACGGGPGPLGPCTFEQKKLNNLSGVATRFVSMHLPFSRLLREHIYIFGEGRALDRFSFCP